MSETQMLESEGDQLDEQIELLIKKRRLNESGVQLRLLLLLK